VFQNFVVYNFASHISAQVTDMDTQQNYKEQSPFKDDLCRQVNKVLAVEESEVSSLP
jgi:hypothetical protein